jgi:hypothetical protein
MNKKIKVKCGWGMCPQRDVEREVDPGILQGDGKVISLFFGHACAECGHTMTLVQ